MLTLFVFIKPVINLSLPDGSGLSDCRPLPMSDCRPLHAEQPAESGPGCGVREPRSAAGARGKRQDLPGRTPRAGHGQVKVARLDENTARRPDRQQSEWRFLLFFLY